MGYLFHLSFITIGVWLIIRDFKLTKGFKTQKLIHVFAILFILFTNIGAFSNLFAIVRNFETFNEWSIYSKIEYFPNSVRFVLSFFSSLLSVILYVFAFGMLSRGDFSRKIIIWIIPVKTLLTLPLIHYLYHYNYNNLEQVVAFWVMIVILSINIGIFFLYRSSYIRSFFDAKNTLA